MKRTAMLIPESSQTDNDMKHRTYGLIRSCAKVLALTTMLGTLSACSFMPSTGPHASLILDPKYNSVPVVDVTEQMAQQMSAEASQAQAIELQNILSAVSVPISKAIIIAPGDIVEVSLWSQSADSETGITATPKPQEFGKYPVDYQGRVDLPYVGHISLKGMTPTEAESVIARKYSAIEMFPKAVASLQVAENKTQNIVVMGAVNAPTVLNWSEGGVDLDEAVAKAGGFKVFDPSKEGSDLSVNNVLLVRSGSNYNIPMKTALEQAVPLHPGDRVVLQHKPVVRALCLGGGWKTPTAVPFDTAPTLSQVLAGAGDMNPQTAQGRAIFVFKHDKRIIYRINFDRPDGMEAAQSFPIGDQDLVYIPVSRSVTLQQAVGIIMTAAYPAMMGAAI